MTTRDGHPIARMDQFSTFLAAKPDTIGMVPPTDDVMEVKKPTFAESVSPRASLITSALRKVSMKTVDRENALHNGIIYSILGSDTSNRKVTVLLLYNWIAQHSLSVPRLWEGIPPKKT